jgi:hypothetical protein
VITEKTTVLEVVQKYPEARRVFGTYNLRYGTCITCGSLSRSSGGEAEIPAFKPGAHCRLD